MRMKEFIIFIIIFTIMYIVFFIVLDKLSAIKLNKDALKRAESLIKIDQYAKFTSFYGIQGTATVEVILKIYEFMRLGKDCIISKEAKKNNLTNAEFVMVVLYLEYLSLISKRIISLDVDYMKKTTYTEQNMIQKYNTYFQNKASFDDISDTIGNQALSDLTYLDHNFLVPGVRFVNSKLYYVGDYL